MLIKDSMVFAMGLINGGPNASSSSLSPEEIAK
jgi:hypothetical protein